MFSLKLSEKKFVGVIFLTNLFIRFFRLDSPSFAYFDERGYYLKAVRAILAGEIDPNYVHPPLAKALIGLAIKLIGDNPWAWRGFQALLASCAVVTIYFIAKRFFSSQKIASLSAFLMTIELSWFSLSRLAIPEMFMISFFVFSLFFMVKFFQDKDNLSLILASLFFGLALACKWAPLIFLPLASYIFLRHFKQTGLEKLKIGLIALLISLTAYLLPFLLLPHHYTVADVVKFHQKTLSFNLVDERQQVKRSTLATSAIFWPVDVYFLHWDKFDKTKEVSAVVLYYNPILLWTALILAFLTIKNFVKNKKLDIIVFLTASFLFFWVVWFVSPRSPYPYYWAIGMPFASLLVASFLAKNYQEHKPEVLGLLSVGVILFLLYYPIMTNWPVKAWYLQLLTGIGFK